MVQLENSFLLFYGYSNSFNPTSFIVQNLTTNNPDDIFVPIKFDIKGSRMNIERIVCRYLSPFVYCGIIHTGHLLTWARAGIQSVNGSIQIANYTSRVFQNHPLWKPVNLEVDPTSIAVEAQAVGKDQLPKILLYNVTASQYVWYSISLSDSAVTSLDVLSFILVNISNKTNVIVANRKPGSNFLMYYESRPMILTVNENLSEEDLESIYIRIGAGDTNDSKYPLTRIFKYQSADSSNPPNWLIIGGMFLVMLFVVATVMTFLTCRREEDQISAREVKAHLKELLM